MGTGMFAQNQAMGGTKYQYGGGDKTSCECQYHKKRSDAKWKHIAAVEMSLLYETNELRNEKSSDSTILGRPDIKCPQCKSKKFSKNGTRKHKHTIISNVQMLKLQVSLYPNLGFKHKRHERKTIISAVLLFSVYIPPTVTRSCLKTAAGMYILPPYRQVIARCTMVTAYVKTLHHPHLGKKISSVDAKNKHVDGKLCCC